MARYDQFTKDFMEKVSEGVQAANPVTPPKTADEVVEDAARKGLATMRTLKNSGPAGLLASNLLPMAAEKLFAKAGSVSVISTFSYLDGKYGSDWWQWEPETIWRTLLEDDGIDATEEVKNLVMALQTVLTSEAAHENWHIFENVCQAFNGNTVDFSTIQPAELNEIALTLKVLNRIRPKAEFDDEVLIYIAASARNSGVVYLPPELYGGKRTPREFLDEMDANPSENKGLIRRVSEAWKSRKPKVGHEMVDMQLAKLNEIKEYVEEYYG